MPKPKLKFNDQEVTIDSGVTTIGRTPDNKVAFPEDSNVSRYHAEIEERGGDYWLIELGSSNGTTLNGTPVRGEVRLANGDAIVLGGSSTVTVDFGNETPQAEESNADTSPAGDGLGQMPNVDAGLDLNAGGVAHEAAGGVGHQAGGGIAHEAAAASVPGNKLLFVGAVGVLAVVLVGGAAAAYYFTRPAACDATALIVKPEAGDTIIAATEIEIDVKNSACVERAVFTIDGVEFAKTEDVPFTATIDPKEFPDLADGFDHSLAIELQDEKGASISKTTPIQLVFETRQVSKPPTNTQVADANTQQQQTGPKGKEVSLIEVQEMSKRLVKQFSGNFAYNVSNKQFLQEVQKKTAEYAQEGYFDRAARYRDAINVAYVREQNLDAPLGFMLAMSRSKFNVDAEGLWKMSNAFVADNKYNGACGTETIADPSQNCAAKASALYMKAVVFGVFDGDVIYSAAAFGKSPQDAAAWKSTLPANRSDVWNSIKTAPEREQIVRFFAAGIVAENPQKFGLKKDRPLSELYRLAM
jgi:transposase